MNIRTLIIIVCLFCSTITKGQIRHYISYNAVVYSNFFNPEKDKSYFPKSILAPGISYKIVKKNIGGELYFLTRYGMHYHLVSYKDNVPDNSILQLYGSALNLNFHYTALSNKSIQINFFLGISKNWFKSIVLEFWYGNPPMYEPKIRYEDESKFGISNGVNIHLPIYKNLYANTNLRYAFFPTAKYNKQNLMCEIGIGYMLQRKAKR